MKTPEIPINEAARLEALESYNLLDTLAENDYDNITRIASLICDTPISTTSLVDTKRQFFKSKIGLPDKETPRENAFCAHAINKPDEMMIVPDSRKDERFADNPLVTGHPYVIFYAGMPLVTPDGYALGTLCVIDNKPRALSEVQKDALKSLASQVTRLLELRNKNELLVLSQNKLASFAREMEAFAFGASHDLKEPLRMVKSFVKLLEKNYAHLLDDTGKTYLKYAVDGSQKMENLINDLLEYAQVGETQANLQQTDLKKIIEEISHMYQSTFTENKVIIQTNDLPTIQAYPTGMKQLFENLIANAIKYQPQNGKPLINIQATETNSAWKFSVSDNGIGIPAHNLQNIFIAFKRLHSKETYAGTGIGLSICSRIVERHGGQIWAESVPGSGSTFYFTIHKHLKHL